MDFGNLEQLHRSVKMQNTRHLYYKRGETMTSAKENIQEVNKMENPLVQTTNKELLRIKTGLLA